MKGQWELECAQCGKTLTVCGPHPKCAEDLQAAAFKMDWRSRIDWDKQVALIFCSSQCVLDNKMGKPVRKKQTMS